MAGVAGRQLRAVSGCLEGQQVLLVAMAMVRAGGQATRAQQHRQTRQVPFLCRAG